jgi:hypothetical protein
MPVDDLDAQLTKEGIDYEQNLENKQLALAQRLDPNAFVGMATNLARTSGSLYNQANRPQPPTQAAPAQAAQSTGIPTIQEGAYELQKPRLLEDDEYSLDPRRFSLTGGFR